MSFALDLSARMAGHAAFSDILHRLESSGAARSIAAVIEPRRSRPPTTICTSSFIAPACSCKRTTSPTGEWHSQSR